LARIDLSAFLGVGGHRRRLQQECVFQMGKEFVKGVARNGNALGFQIGGKTGHREQTGRTAQQAPHQPAECGDIGDLAEAKLAAHGLGVGPIEGGAAGGVLLPAQDGAALLLAVGKLLEFSRSRLCSSATALESD
jgi:hypothetical protein